MSIVHLQIKHFRNISDLECTPDACFNIIIGDNGSGKTSFLESIYVLGFGRTFRSPQLQMAIQNGAPSLLTRMQVEGLDASRFYMGLEKHADRRAAIKVAGKQIASASKLARHLPVLFISPESFDLLHQGPLHRRKFVDWGAFHAEDSFATLWQQFNHVLRQRNALLKQKASPSMVESWNHEFVRCGEALTKIRRSYLTRLWPCLKHMLEDLLPLEGLEIDFWQGWSELLSLEEALKETAAQESRLGYAMIGPQRADLQFKLYGLPASQMLSRGQQKMLVCALYLAQGKVMADVLNKQTVYLVDDLSAELDLNHRHKFLKCLYELKAQCFITGIERSLLQPLLIDYPHQVMDICEGRLSSEGCVSRETQA